MGKILVTGGTGFIGSHACVSLINAGYSVVVVDNLCNSKVEALARIQLITGKQVRFYQADLRDEESIRQIFIDNKIKLKTKNGIFDIKESDIEFIYEEIKNFIEFKLLKYENK